jgi:hypothetical protein
MNDFDRKWQECAAAARQAGQRDESMPFGFTTRVLAAAWPRQKLGTPLELVWQRLTLGCLGIVGLVLLACAALEVPHFADQKPLDPGIETTVAQLIWSL